MLSIRLQRTGKKHQPQFRIVLAQKEKHPSKKFLEILGNYNPRNKEFSLKNPERAQYWLSQHVEVSPTVHNLFVEKGIAQAEKVKAWRPKIKAQATAPAAAPKAQAQAPAETAPEPVAPVLPVAEEAAAPEPAPAEEAKSE